MNAFLCLSVLPVLYIFISVICTGFNVNLISRQVAFRIGKLQEAEIAI